MNNKPIWMKLSVCIFPLAALGLVYMFRAALIKLGTYFPACPSYTYLKIYCPGCGNTRSVQHLLSGDLLGSLSFNPGPLFGIIVGVLAYIELIAYVFGKKIILVPRSRNFWFCIIAVFLFYFIIRNITGF